jgi:hypothetical protein
MDPPKLPLKVMAKTAASIMITQPDIKARAAMIMAGYSEQDAKNDNKQRYVRKRRKIMLKEQGASKTPESQVEAPKSTTNASSQPIKTKKKLRRMMKKGYRLSPTQLLKQQSFELGKKRVQDAAMMEATEIYASEKKKKDGKTSRQVAEEVGKKYDTTLSDATVRDKVRRGQIGDKALKRCGPVGNFPDGIWNAFKGGFSSMTALNQAAGCPELKERNVRDILYKVISPALKSGKKICPTTLYRRLKKECSDILTSDKEYYVEMRRLIWTTHENLDLWFDVWKKTLVEFGFATDEPELDEDGEVISEITISKEQKRRIVNMDETKICLDGSDGREGGRPASIIAVKGAVRVGTGTSKSGTSCTLICGMASNGDTLPTLQSKRLRNF